MIAQRPGYVPPDRRLLRNNKPHTNQYTDTAPNSYNQCREPALQGEALPTSEGESPSLLEVRGGEDAMGKVGKGGDALARTL
jgi:hypothetical protein